jgi:hypothetical protein
LKLKILTDIKIKFKKKKNFFTIGTVVFAAGTYMCDRAKKIDFDVGLNELQTQGHWIKKIESEGQHLFLFWEIQPCAVWSIQSVLNVTAGYWSKLLHQWNL